MQASRITPPWRGSRREGGARSQAGGGELRPRFAGAPLWEKGFLSLRGGVVLGKQPGRCNLDSSPRSTQWDGSAGSDGLGVDFPRRSSDNCSSKADQKGPIYGIDVKTFKKNRLRPHGPHPSGPGFGPGGLECARIARSYDIPPHLMAKVLQKMAQSGIVVSHQGTHGGYSLGRPAHLINAAEVIESIEGPFSMTSCVSETGYCLPV